MGNLKKTVEVVCAIACKNSKVFIAQRKDGTWAGYWEFPGGKIESGETCEQALRRELQEELGTDAKIGELFTVLEHEYPEFHLKMYCYLSEFYKEPELIVHTAHKWLHFSQLDKVKWLPADIYLLPELKRHLQVMADKNADTLGE